MPRKLLVILVSTAVILSLSVAPALAARHFNKRNSYAKRSTFASHMRHSHKAVLHMYPVNETGQWTFSRNAPKGFLKYNLWGATFDFTFRGINLSPDTPYTLIYYKEGEASDIVQLGDGFTDARGNIYFENSVDTCSMPAGDDILSRYGARMMLVPSDSIYDDAGFILPDAGTFLEGFHLIRFFDFNGCPTVDPVYEEPVEEEPVEEEPAYEDPGDPVDEGPAEEEPAEEDLPINQNPDEAF